MNVFRHRYQDNFWRLRYVKGSTVIEMSYIMPLFFLLFVLLVHTVFYYHDKAIINGAAAETAILGVQVERRKESGYDLEQFFRERISGKLIFVTDIDVSVKESKEEISILVHGKKSFMKLAVCQKARIVRPEKRIRQVGWSS